MSTQIFSGCIIPSCSTKSVAIGHLSLLGLQTIKDQTLTVEQCFFCLFIQVLWLCGVCCAHNHKVHFLLPFFLVFLAFYKLSTGHLRLQRKTRMQSNASSICSFKPYKLEMSRRVVGFVHTIHKCSQKLLTVHIGYLYLAVGNDRQLQTNH